MTQLDALLEQIRTLFKETVAEADALVTELEGRAASERTELFAQLTQLTDEREKRVKVDVQEIEAMRGRIAKYEARAVSQAAEVQRLKSEVARVEAERNEAKVMKSSLGE